MTSRRFWVAVLLTVGFARGPACADILVTSISRTVTAAATGAIPIGVSDTSIAPGTYIHSVTSHGITPPPPPGAGDILAMASQSSVAPTPMALGITGTGATSASAIATGLDGFSVLADSFFDITFTVDIAGTYSFDATATWGGSTPPFGGFSTVELKDLTHMLTLAMLAKGPGAPGTASLSTTFPLLLGTSYNLVAKSHIDGGFATPGMFIASAGWTVDMTSVPEAGGFILSMPVILGLAIVGWLRRK